MSLFFKNSIENVQPTSSLQANTEAPEVAEKPEPKQDSDSSEADEIIDSFLETDEAEAKAKGDSNNG